MRRVVVLLLTVNACYFLWSVLEPGSSPVSPAAWPDSVPALEIADSEVMAAPLSGVAVSPAPVPAADAGPEEAVTDAVDTEGLVADEEEAPSGDAAARCWRIGPFVSSEVRDSFVRERLAGVSVAVIEEQQDLVGDWRVFLPPAESRSAAVALRERFQSVVEEAGENFDSYVMTGGARVNGVSLGLFRQESNARNLLARVTELGMEVRVERETTSRDVEWVEVTAEAGWMDEARRSGLASYAPELQILENVCQTIAP